MPTHSRERAGFSLSELLCVVAILSILAALYLGAIAKAFSYVKAVLDSLR